MFRAFVLAGALVAWSGVAEATDVTFSGTITGICTLALSLPGTLAMSIDGTKMGSDEPGGIPATVAILSVGSNTVSVGAPTRTGSPGAYSPTGESVWVSYVGLGGLSLINHPYDTATSTFGINTLPLSVLSINTRILNAGHGFDAGTYTTRTVVTCS